jgi:rubrerythrin
MFKHLEGGTVEITASYPAGKIGTTAENLAASAAGENEEYTTLYPEFAKVAQEEGLNEIATMYRMISKAEMWHEQRYKSLLASVESQKVFKKDTAQRWKCEKCGYIHEAEEAPKICPLCKHPQKYFQIVAENR